MYSSISKTSVSWSNHGLPAIRKASFPTHMVDRLLRMLCSFVSRTSLPLDPNRFLSSFPNSETRQPRPHHHGDIMMGPKIRCNFREPRLAELLRTLLPQTPLNRALVVCLLPSKPLCRKPSAGRGATPS